MEPLTPGQDGIVNRSVLCMVWIISNGSINIILRLKSQGAWHRIMEMEEGFIYYFHFISVSVFFHFYIISHSKRQAMIHILKLHWAHTLVNGIQFWNMLFSSQNQFPNDLHLQESGGWGLMERHLDRNEQMKHNLLFLLLSYCVISR